MPITPITPAASPVNRFVRPALPEQATQVVGENSAQQLARALSSVYPSVMGTLEHHQDQVDQTAVDTARAQRLKTALNFQDAIKQGIITPDQSPIFRKAWQQQD